MPKLIKLSGRILRRTYRASSRERSMRNFLLTLAVFIGLARPPALFKHWIEADPEHRIMVGLAFFLVLFFLAAYEAEEELDARDRVKITLRKLRAIFRPIYSVDGGRSEQPNVLMIDAELSFRNDGEKSTRLYFPKIEILRRSRFWRWEPIPMQRLIVTGSVFPRNVPRQSRWVLWSVNQRHEITALDEVVGNVHIFWTLPQSSLVFLDRRDLRVRFTLDIAGRGEVLLEEPIQEITREESKQSVPKNG
jgi:hypothetical protein